MPSPKNRFALLGSNREPVASASAPTPIDNHELVQVTVVLRRRTHTQLPEPEKFAFHDSQTVNYHTRGDFGVLHGADPADIAAVEAFAHENGLTVVESSAARRSVVLKGTAANMQRAFGTSLTHYTPEGTYRGRTGSLTFPESSAVW